MTTTTPPGGAPPGRTRPAVVAVTGAESPVGRHLQRLAATSATLSDIRLVDLPGAASGPAAGEGWCEGVEALVVLGPSSGPELDGLGGSELDLAAIRKALADAGDAGVRHVTVLSSAMVYGAWADNPVPLTEEAPIRPGAGLASVTARAELERLAASWRAEHPGATVAVLRPVVAVAAERAEWFRRSPWRAAGIEVGEAEPPRQFVHLDDVASAIELSVRDHLDGPFNVAPDGWLAADTWRELTGPAPRLKLARSMALRVARMRFRAGLSAVPPELMDYVAQPWVVANDRLRSAGWVPGHTNEEAYVVVDRAGPLRSLSPRVRQELSLGAAGAVLVAAVAAVVLLVRRRRRPSQGRRR